MENPNNFMVFSGILSAEDHAWPVQLQARVNPEGEIEFAFSPIVRTSQTVAISHLFQRPTGRPIPFHLVADGADGTHFNGEHLILTGLTSDTADGVDTVLPRMTCLKGVFSKARPGIDRPAVYRPLRGFECWRPVTVTCRLGEITIAGASGSASGGNATGLLSIRATVPPEDEVEWLAQVDHLLTHVRWILSFAAGIDLKAPTSTTFARGCWTLEVLSQAPIATGGLVVVHPSDLSEIFAAAVNSFFAPPIKAERLYFAIEWFVTPGRHKETRLTNAMTALENLVNSNLPEEATRLLPPKRFDKMAKLMRQALKDEAAAIVAADKPGATIPEEVLAERRAEEAFRETLASKMRELNRRPLGDKIHQLVDLWGVPAQDLSAKSLTAAIGARNLVVHEGYYAEHPKGGSDHGDLWEHIFTVRELVERIIMTVIGYAGPYLNFRAGETQKRFPPADARPGLAA
jgi:hypothetical protein